MLVKECMTKNVRVISPNKTICDAAQEMRDGDFGSLPVGENDRLIGVITDRDIAVRAVAEGKSPNDTEIREVMSEGVLYCFEDQSITEVTRNMGDKQVRRLPVLNREKRLVGILSLGDVAQKDNTKDEAEEALSQISGPEHREVEAINHARAQESLGVFQ
jgi:CBS domain-containing protein